jgi:hypothetical protein
MAKGYKATRKRSVTANNKNNRLSTLSNTSSFLEKGGGNLKILPASP